MNRHHRRWTLHLSHLALIALTIWLHLQMAQQSFQIQLDNSKAAAFAFDVLSQHPQLLWRIGGPVLVAALMYTLLFGFIRWLARTPDSTPIARALGVLLLSWASVSWLLLRAHAQLFPRSAWAWLIEPLSLQTASPVADIAATLFIITCFIRKLRETTLLPRRIAAIGSSAVIFIVCIAALLQHWHTAKVTTTNKKQPNLIVIGLDSMRRDLMLSANAKDLPNLAALRDRSFIEVNVVSPLARTFPAWNTILTGKDPAQNGVRENLAPQQLVARDTSLGWWMKERGYRTIYATDETRFSNIGKEYGFDQIVSPMPGAPDFLISQFADQPMINLALMLPYAEYVFPSLVGNRAFAHAYYPQRFIDRLETAIGSASEQPQFLAIHLCLAHWPYYSALSPTGASGDGPYHRATQELDLQLGALMEMLRRRGYLQPPTLLVVLSDHGEGLEADASPTRHVVRVGTERQPSMLTGGHGNTLLEPDQFQVFALFSGQSALGAIPHGTSQQLAALQDIAPTLQALLGSTPSSTRMAIADAFGPLQPQRLPRAYVAIETGFRPHGFDVLHPDGDAALRIASSSFDILHDGRLEMKPQRYRDAIKDKDYGVTDGSAVLALVRDNRGALLVNALQDRSWRIYPTEKPKSETAPTLLDAACSNVEMSPQIASWCGGHHGTAATP